MVYNRAAFIRFYKFLCMYGQAQSGKFWQK
jgi:hypothetical protein